MISFPRRTWIKGESGWYSREATEDEKNKRREALITYQTKQLLRLVIGPTDELSGVNYD